MTGATVIGHELLIAVLTMLFYRHNRSKNGIKHVCNSKVSLVPHPRVFKETGNKSLEPPLNHDFPTTADNAFDERYFGLCVRMNKLVNDHVYTLRSLQDACKKEKMELQEYFPFDDILPRNHGYTIFFFNGKLFCGLNLILL